jgi:perosamine synthetase
MSANIEVHQITILNTATIQDALKVLDKTGLGIVFVVDRTQALVGVATDGDIRRGFLQGATTQAPITQVMNPNFVWAKAGAQPADILTKMSEAIRHVPLLDEDGRLVDYVSFSQFYRLPVAEPLLSGNELRYVTECVLTNWISSAGSFVTRFEQMFAEFCGVNHAVAVSNGTVALHLALVVLGIGPGDEVIVPSLTFAATANAVFYTGAKPVFADSHPDTWTIDADSIVERITPRTRAIIPVHLYGHPADMEPIMELARRHNLWVVEDAAEAHGARYKGQYVGSIGDIGCFSFYGNKIITTGEGGMLTMNNPSWDEKARMLRDHGMSKNKRYWHPVVGYNYRLTNIQAAIGVAQMEQVETILRRKQQIADLYTSQLTEVPGLTVLPSADWAEPVCWLYSVLVEEGKAKVSRDEVIALMEQQGVDTRPFFFPLTKMPPYERISKNAQPCPVAERLSASGLSLPSSTKLTNQDIMTVSHRLRDILLC